MAVNLVDLYAVSLAALHGSDFQAEVSARLSTTMNGLVQVVPQYPQGDGGVDCLSHNGTHGYCCYGPEPDVAKTDRGRVSAITRKFTGDLQRLFELTPANGVLVHRENTRLPNILVAGVKIRHLTLVTNWFRSHELIGALQTVLAACKVASQCRYIDPSATLVIKGPNELANDHGVDEVALVRINQRAFLARIEATAANVTLAESPTFDGKIAKLHAMVEPAMSQAVDTLAENWRKLWRIALAFEHELDQTVPMHHEALQRARLRLATDVLALRLAPKGPLDYILPAQALAKDILSAEFRSTYGSLVDDLAPGETARLIGECTLDWNPAPAPLKGN